MAVRAYIGLGANVGDARATLAAAVRALSGLAVRFGAAGEVRGTVAGVSRLYVTRPVDVVEQPEFHNAVVGLDFEMDAVAPSTPSPSPSSPSPEDALRLLVALKELEREFGRQERFRHGPRELDLDLLLFGDLSVEMDRPPEARSLDPAKAARLLVVPHPEASRRLFVLAPLSDLDPGLRPPGWTESVSEARRHQEGIEGADAVRAVGAWDPEAWDWR